jgi:NAD(P)-dependent dehydrogenase (short-subunit alcohol dehydrogenase family)
MIHNAATGKEDLGLLRQSPVRRNDTASSSTRPGRRPPRLRSAQPSQAPVHRLPAATVPWQESAGDCPTLHSTDRDTYLAQVEALAATAADIGTVTQVIQAAGVSPTQASIERLHHVDLLGTAYGLDAFARVIAPGIVVASMAGHRESPYPREIEQALATTETSQLLALPFPQPEQLGSSLHACAMSKRANSLRVQTAAAAWGKRGARVNAISPDVIITPLALDELSGPRREWFETVRETSATKRFGTFEEVAAVTLPSCSAATPDSSPEPTSSWTAA